MYECYKDSILPYQSASINSVWSIRCRWGPPPGQGLARKCALSQKTGFFRHLWGQAQWNGLFSAILFPHLWNPADKKMTQCFPKQLLFPILQTLIAPSVFIQRQEQFQQREPLVIIAFCTHFSAIILAPGNYSPGSASDNCFLHPSHLPQAIILRTSPQIIALSTLFSCSGQLFSMRQD